MMAVVEIDGQTGMDMQGGGSAWDMSNRKLNRFPFHINRMQMLLITLLLIK
jgi:hypothetical protein